MIPVLGRGLVLAALLFATVGSATGLYAGIRRSPEGARYARLAALGFSAAMILANLLMVYALVTHDFSVKYVAEVGSTKTPTYFTVISLWASLHGSILFWGGILALYTGGFVLAIGDRYKEYMPWTLHVQLGIAVFFSMLVAGIANPFEPMSPIPLDGPGPNPLLQNHWLMALHPPTLYMGYVGMSVPFSMICAALLAGRLEAGWLSPVRTWMLIPWTFLSCGIVLGGWWSYEVLGWGGAWAWDPVENASFHPWLTGTAFLHSVMVLQRRNTLRDWTLMLGMATFLLTLVGTFMTRSGVFNSVHSFTQSDIGPVFLGFIAFTLIYSVILLAFRSHTLDDAGRATDAQLGAVATQRGSAVERLFSREFAILAQNALFSVFTFTVLLLTLYPLITEAVLEKRVSVGEPAFDRWALPIGLAIVFLMGVGPALPWGRMNPLDAWRRLMPAVGFGALSAAALAGFGYTKPMTVLTVGLAGFALVANLGELLTPVRARMKSHAESPVVAARQVFTRARRRFGSVFAHIGIVFAVCALALTKGYRVEKDVTLSVGQSVSFEGWDLKYAGSKFVDEGYRQSVLANFEVTKQGTLIDTVGPRMNFYKTQREPVFTPAVHSQFNGDLYLSLVEVPTDGKQATLRVIWEPFQVWLWLAAPMIALGSGLAIWPERRRRAAAPALAGEAMAPGAAK